MSPSSDGRLPLLLAAALKLWLDARLPRRLENTWKLPSRMCFAALVTPKIFLCWYINSNSSYLVMTSEMKFSENRMNQWCRNREQKIYLLWCAFCSNRAKTLDGTLFWKWRIELESIWWIEIRWNYLLQFSAIEFFRHCCGLSWFRLPHTKMNNRLTAFRLSIYIKVLLSQNSFQIFNIYKSGKNAQLPWSAHVGIIIR